MITFEHGIDIRNRSVQKPTVARFKISPAEVAYCVIGTEYGHIHTTAGDVRTWKSYSGARRAARRYAPF